MGKKIFLSLILFALLSTVAHAQKTSLVRSLARPFARGGRDFAVAVGNYQVVIPNVVRQVVASDLVHDYFLFGAINPQHYPRLSAQNEALTFRAFQNFAADAQQFQKQFPQIANQVRVEIAHGSLNYSQWLPQDPGIIYLGEIHGHQNVQREVLSFLRQLSHQYPQRPIILATEFLSFDPSVSLPENIIASVDDVQAYFDRGNPAGNWNVLKDALSIPNVYLIGLENHAVLHRILKRSDGGLTTEEYDDFMGTYAGMNLRNRLFARTLTRLQELAPEALIVAYGGISHFSLHEEGSVPSLVPGKNFIIQLATPESLPYANLLNASLSVSEPSLHMFEKSSAAKIVAGWKSPFSDYRHLLGNDLSVIVHD